MPESGSTVIAALGDPVAERLRARLAVDPPEGEHAAWVVVTPAALGDAAFHERVRAAQGRAVAGDGPPVALLSEGVPPAVIRGLFAREPRAVDASDSDRGLFDVLASGPQAGTTLEPPHHTFHLSVDARAAEVLPVPVRAPVALTQPGVDAPEVDWTTLLIGGRYRVESQLGVGASSRVWLAVDTATGQPVAVKTSANADPALLHRFMEEFRRAADVSHPNLVALHELFFLDDHLCIVMELVDGVDFRTWLQGTPSRASLPRAPQGWDRVREAFLQLVEGVAALHGEGLVHLDLKPQNVLVDRAGRVKVLDFGLARELAGLTDYRGFAGGTLQYMPLEQLAAGALGPAADWYAVGVMLFEALTDRLPAASGHPMEVAEARRFLPVVPPSRLVPGVPPDLDRLCVELLSPDPAARPDVHRIWTVLAGDEPSGAHARPRPMVAPTFVGREAEAAALDAALARVEAHGAGAVWLSGPSGIGKSALRERVLDRWRAAGALVLAGGCREREHVPFRGVDRAVAALAEEVRREAQRRAHLLPLLQPVGRLFPAVRAIARSTLGEAEPPVPDDPAEVRRRGFEALRTILRELGAARPVVLAVDDLHWGDLDGAQLVAALLAAPDPPRLLFLATAREGAEAGPFRAELADRLDLSLLPGGFAELRLGPLPPDAAQGLARSLLGTRGDAGRVDQVVQAAGGHPFLLGEVARVSADLADALPGGPDDPQLRLGRLLSRRVEALAPEARALLEVVSVASWPIRLKDAYEALGPDVDRLRALHALRSHQLLRAEGSWVEDRVECYHDRIRETVREGLDPERRGEWARRLLRSVDDDPRVGPAQKVPLLDEAGDRVGAAALAAVAAEEAARTLAFAEAARLWGLARSLGGAAGPRLGELWEREAAAWSDAGHPQRAADGWLAAAALVPAERGFRDRVRAVEHLLGGGHVDRGVRELRPLLDEVGLAWPSVPGVAWTVATRLPWLWLRGTRFRPVAEAELPRLVRDRIDLCASIGQGLAVIDLLRAGRFTLLGLHYALQAGEPRRVARGLAMFGAALLAPLGGGMARWGDRLLAEAERIAADLDDPSLTSVALVCRGQAELLAGRWAPARAHFEEGEKLLRRIPSDSTWAKDVGRMGLLRALEELGRLAEVGDLADRTVAEAEETGDNYAQVTALLYGAYARFCHDDPAGARARARAAMQLWHLTDYTVQHLYAMRVEAVADLWEGRPDAAWERLAAAEPAIRRAGFLRVPITILDVSLLRGRAALALAAADPARRGAMLAEVDACVAALSRLDRDDARAAAHQLRAARLDLAGSAGEAAGGWVAARRGYEAAGMAVAAAGVGWREAARRGDGSARDASEARLRAAGVRTPERWARVHVPG